ncbi:MAG: fluoride efflux transporter CrcB [Chitinophagaceae bacterium]|nr:fluoride efflux transporter CrcB [Chitinophagaceae bacterium]MCW5928939.1 fluoride efflux transporter CrcB [Chitinophagaceae bacterium]
MIKEVIVVGLGGGVGSIFRYLTSLLINKQFPHRFPFATFTVNILGCLAIGFLIGFFQKHSGTAPHIRLLLATGFCGGFTTFSAFAAENMQLLQSGNSFTAIAYIAASTVGGLLAVWSGMALSRA